MKQSHIWGLRFSILCQWPGPATFEVNGKTPTDFSGNKIVSRGDWLQSHTSGVTVITPEKMKKDCIYFYHVYIKGVPISVPFLPLQLFSDVLVDDPVLVKEIAMSVVESGADEEKKQSKGKQTFILDSFSRLLELVTLRHRLIESTMESARLARLVLSTCNMGGHCLLDA